jgi:hypothetical protein
MRNKRNQAMRENPNKEPFRCPKCGRIWTGIKVCSPKHGGCGYELTRGEKIGRPVVTTDGTLRIQEGHIRPPRRVMRHASGIGKWKIMYYRAKSKKWNASFQQAFALFARENYGQWPDRTWPLMPLTEHDAYRKVSDVPYDRLIPERQHA